jgi:hypothetical protein
MMDRRHKWAAVAAIGALSLLVGVVGAAADDGDDDARQNAFTFALWGDTPYSATEVSKLPALIADINAAKVAFSVFDGDIKSGSSQCTDGVFAAAIQRFGTFQSPMVYVPGDNEWTDCHRINNGSYNALERLSFLRQTMFAEEQSFGQRTLLLEHQGPLGGMYSENTRWIYGDVVFLGLNIPGSDNNKVDVGPNNDCTMTLPLDCTTGKPIPPPPNVCLFAKSARTCDDCKADNAEYAARDENNIAWLRESFAIAKSRRLKGLMVVIQADMGFDLPETEAFNDHTRTTEFIYDGYTKTLHALIDESKDFDGQVVLVHGDTHFFKLDKPLKDCPDPTKDCLMDADATHEGNLVPNFSRLETFGSPNVHWVKVTVDPRSRNVFRSEPMIVPGN